MNENKITGLVIWNAVLSILVFMLMVTLWATQEDLKTLAHENAAFLELLDQMVETDKLLAEVVETNADSIGTNAGSIGTNADSISLLLDVIMDNDEWATQAIAEIYQGHIVPLRALHMENGD